MAETHYFATSEHSIQVGDSVRFNEQRNASEKLRRRIGVVVGRSRIKGKLRVRWNGLKHPQIVHETVLQLVEARGSNPNSTESVVGAISIELEKLRDARFERHLKWPREVPLHTYTSSNAVSQRKLVGYMPLLPIGILAVSIAIGAACIAFLAH